MNTKIAKACEPCRVRKSRCDGGRPCQRRECREFPQNCVYRSKARVRKSAKQRLDSKVSPPSPLNIGRPTNNIATRETPSSLWSDNDLGDKEDERGAQHEVYHSVAETHLAPKSTDSSQLFYGPSSSFAFLQQIHRSVLSVTNRGRLETSYGRSGLDIFMQRSIFFGTPPRINPDSIRSSNIPLKPVSQEKAKAFLELFKITSHYRLPFYSTAELDSMFENLYSKDDHQPMPPQTKANFLAILAIGALSTPETELAETLFTEAKREVVIFDDAVTLQMLQLSILFSDYQVNMGRPNSTYLHLGVACRKAFALGLHTEALATRLDEATLLKHRTTLWSLYFYETCQALLLGRRSGIKLCDIACPSPTEPSATRRLYCYAKIMEDTADLIYGRKTTSLRELYVIAEGLHGRVRQFALDHGIASAYVSRSQSTIGIHEHLLWYSIYYLAIILIFRPFLVADYAMRVNRKVEGCNEMWLRQACRHAVDAAQDSIESIGNTLINDKISNGIRYQAYFLECSCGILLYDILSHPSKYTYNMEYIRKAMRALSCMVPDEPVTTALNSIDRVVETIESSISSQVDGPRLSGSNNNTIAQQHYADIEFPSSDQLGANASEKMIFLTGRSGPVPSVMNPSTLGSSDITMDQDWLNPNYFDLNVMTTDLFNFFPMDVFTPLEHGG
ncbi:Zinc finger protein grt1 [Paramyrothecium foliicola]|nr:Zinc finger protein grt1 [Paramyrothecium foliicola]